MRLHKVLMVAAAAGMLLTRLPAAGAQEMSMGHHLEGMEILHGLNLSSVQRDKVHGIIKAAYDQAKPLIGKMHALHEQMADAMLAPGNVDEAQLTPLLQQQDALHQQIEQVHVHAMVQIRALLTPDQVSHAAELHKKLASLHDQERAVMGEGGEE